MDEDEDEMDEDEDEWRTIQNQSSPNFDLKPKLEILSGEKQNWSPDSGIPSSSNSSLIENPASFDSSGGSIPGNNSTIPASFDSSGGSITGNNLTIPAATAMAGKIETNNNSADDIMREFTDFVDLVDSLNGMPEIDFEDNFEMFP
jgi:hypothetical protein